MVTRRNNIPKGTIVVPGNGPPCPRCHQSMQIREHRNVTERESSRPFYYSRWYRCMHGDCRTTLVMPEEFRVYREPPDIASVSDDPFHQDIVSVDPALLTERLPWE